MTDNLDIENESSSDVQVIDIPECTPQEENFALAFVDLHGNAKEAYRAVFGADAGFPNARAKELLSRTQVAMKVRQLTESIAENVSLSIEAHLGELSDIRDLAKYSGQLKTALAAERARGEAVGIYQRHDPAKVNSGQTTQIVIQMASKHDIDI